MTLLLLWVGVAAIVLGSLAFPFLQTWWHIRRATASRTIVAARQVGQSPGTIDLEVRVATAGRRVTIVAVEVERPLSDLARVAPPAGFRIAPHVTGLNPDDKGYSLAARWDDRWTRHVGSLAVESTHAARLSLPICEGAAGSGTVRLRYVDEIAIGGALVDFADVPVAVGVEATREAPRRDPPLAE